jgi:hypothetical protein
VPEWDRGLVAMGVNAVVAVAVSLLLPRRDVTAAAAATA